MYHFARLLFSRHFVLSCSHQNRFSELHHYVPQFLLEFLDIYFTLHLLAELCQKVLPSFLIQSTQEHRFVCLEGILLFVLFTQQYQAYVYWLNPKLLFQIFIPVALAWCQDYGSLPPPLQQGRPVSKSSSDSLRSSSTLSPSVASERSRFKASSNLSPLEDFFCLQECRLHILVIPVRPFPTPLMWFLLKRSNSSTVHHLFLT